MNQLTATHNPPLGDWEVLGREQNEESTPGPEDFAKPFVVLRWLYRKCDWPPREKAAYTALYLRRSAESPEPWPTIRTLAKEIGTTPDAALAAISALVALGALKVATRASPHGSNVYTLIPPWEALQRAPRKPRGRYAACSENKNALSNQEQVVRKSRTIPVSIQEHKEPTKKEPKRRSQDIPSSASASQRKSSQRKTPNPLSEDAQKIVARFHDLLVGHGQPEGVSNWAAARKIAENALKGSGGAAPMPVEEALDTLEWAFASSPRWRQALMAYGLRNLRSAWAEWKDKGRKTGRKPFAEPLTGNPEDWFA